MKVLVCDPTSLSALDYLRKNRIETDYNPKITNSEILENIADYEFLIVKSRTKVTNEIIGKARKLIAIGRIGTGLDNIDLTAAKNKHIRVINSPKANSQSVAELTVSLAISLLRNLGKAYESMKKGDWDKQALMGSELSGKTVGILGFGFIGKKVKDILSSFGCRFFYFSPSTSNCSIEDLFSKSDIITLHLTLNSATRGLVNSKLLNLMKNSSYLINTSRGEIIDEEALFEILSQHKIKGAALDVFWEEPLPALSRWRKLDNVILTPHIGASTVDAQERAGKSVAEDIVRLAKGEDPEG